MKNSQLLKKCSTYSAIEQTMRNYEYAYLNGMAFKNAVRKKRPSEDEKLHFDLVANTAAMPIARYVVDTLNDTVFSDEIYRDLCFATPTGQEIESEILTQWVELFLYDADLNNRSLDSVMEHIGEMTSIFGYCWVFVDMPSEDQGTSGRPYVCVVNPLDVWDWHHTAVNGRYIPSYVKVKEYEDNHEYIFKCYYLGTTSSPSYWETHRVQKLGNPDTPAELVEEGQFPPGMSIPGFIAFTRRDPRTIDVGVSDIDSATDVQREVYKLECEAYQSIQFAKTLIRADAGVKVPALAGGIIRASEGQVESITVDTQDVDRIINKQDNLIMNLENLSGFGGLRQNKSATQSGVSMIEERKGLHKAAKAKARELEIAEESIFTYAARFMGMRWAGKVAYGCDYEAHDTKYQIALMTTAQQLAGDNPVIRGIITNKVLEMLVDADEVDLYRERLIAIDPNSVDIEEPGESDEIETRDIGDQTPKSIPQHDREIINSDTSQYSDVGIQYTGISSFNPIADQLVARAGGR